ncbi:hypothetical protein OIU34_21525 [Pararhizobium sp. BT-229]|uniref:hypothetical protein n=1 Tax=Pararhizobium sp. BT-229 TaxID=2986923 RepID=UPI0021F75D78|nr:hypothetical protein [Pararhizobium sp. BT-229]MCV9964474.1 hypothetical protein [Pararhizobium sp. BT-229]
MKNVLSEGPIGDLHGQMCDLVRNPFRNDIMRRQFDAAVSTYDTKHRDFIYPNGRRCVGSAWATNFWRGFEGMAADRWKKDAAARQTPAYACWCAGRDIRAALDAHAATLTDTTERLSEGKE